MNVLCTLDGLDLDVVAKRFLRFRASELETTPAVLLRELVEGRAIAAILHRRPSDELLLAWRRAIGSEVHVAYVIGVEGRALPGVHPHVVQASGAAGIEDALRWFERDVAQAVDCEPAADRSEVVLVGAGVVNLMTASALVDAGFDVRVVDASPEPGGPWHRYGCTHAGDDARMFTFTEMDCYNRQASSAPKSEVFRRPVRQGGWNALDRPLSVEEASWVHTFENIPPWLSRAYNDDILALSAEAYGGWSDMAERYPGLFDQVGFAPDILRLYSDPGQFDGAVTRHQRVGAIRDVFSADEIPKRFPAFADPVVRGRLSGALVVPGFTVNIHRFSRALIRHLEARGVSFTWDTMVDHALRSATGRIESFTTRAGAILETGMAHVVLSPGVDAGGLLDGSACANRIHGVIGGWMRIPNTNGLTMSMKLARRGHSTEDANITVGRNTDGTDVLIIGSGYGYIGADPTVGMNADVRAIRAGIEDTVREYFPEAAEALSTTDSPSGEGYGFKFCVRPWTATSLGIFHHEAMTNGGSFIVTGGHNTGGFAQAPVIADAVVARLRGRAHPMHWMYRPDRLECFLGDAGLSWPSIGRDPALESTAGEQVS